MESIMDCLVKAGYYRARISTISNFDKIIGGMAWAMQLFSYDINIDVFYTDTLDLGQKIALTERIVMVLLALKCPYRIEPHQIVGLDYDSLFPVIVWLIKRSEEIRHEHEKFNRLLALRHYHRVTNTSPDRSEWCHVIRMQAEYPRSQSNVAASQESAASAAANQILEQIHQTYKDNEQVSFVNLATLIRASHDAAAANSDETKQHRNQEAVMLSDKFELVKLDGRPGESDQEITTCFTDDDAQTTIANEANQHDTTLTSSIEKMRLNLDDGQMDDKCLLEGALSAEELELHRNLDLELLATNQKILNLLKKLDTMPSQLEIRQYQTRYVELHQQLIEKNKSVKKLFDLHNSLDVTRHYLEKELNLLESISDNLQRSNDSDSNRDSFLRQMNDIVVKILSIRDDMAAKAISLRNKCNSLNDEYDELLRQLTGGNGPATSVGT